MTLKEFIDLVQERLSAHYPAQECKAIALRMLKECLCGYRGYEHLVEPGRSVCGFALSGAFVKGCAAGAGAVGAGAVDAGAADAGAVDAGAADSGAGCNADGMVEAFLLAAVERLSTGEPLQYVLGYEWFCGHRFNVAPGVLVPRPETEELVRGVVERAERSFKGSVEAPLRILDICTGSGCIAWSVAAALPGAQVFGCDISSQALGIARGQEVYAADGEGRAAVKFFECDILAEDALERIARECGEAKFDIVVSNPPYVCESEKALMRRNVLDFEPAIALFVPDSNPLLFYRRIAELSGKILEPGGRLLFEINERFGKQTADAMEGVGFKDCKVLEDFFGKDRMVEGIF